LQFQREDFRLPFVGDRPNVERAQETPEENAQAQVQEVAPAPKISTP
jgi:hypothetical protein